MDKPLAFTYIGVVDEQFAVFPEHYSTIEEVQLNIKFNFPYDYANRSIGCELIVDFHHAEQPIYLRCGTTCVFKLHEDSWNSRLATDEEAVDLEEEAIVHFAAFTTGTLRGVLHARQQPIPVNAILPPVNVFELLGIEGQGTRRLSAIPAPPLNR